MRKAIKEKILQQKKGSQFYVKMICMPRERQDV